MGQSKIFYSLITFFFISLCGQLLDGAECPYPTAHDKPLDASREVIHETENYIQYRVEFNGIQNDRVPAYLYVPKGINRKYPALFMQYGWGGYKGVDYIVQLAQFTVLHGYCVLTIDSPNCGERKNSEIKDPKFKNGKKVMHYCGDYSRAVDYLAVCPEIDKNRLGYVGTSRGAINGIIFAAYEPRIKAVCSVVGGGNFFGLRSLGLKGDVWKSDPVYHVSKIDPRPILFINATEDEIIKPSWAESLHRAAGPHAEIIWLKSDHMLSDINYDDLCSYAVDFFDEYLN